MLTSVPSIVHLGQHLSFNSPVFYHIVKTLLVKTLANLVVDEQST